MGALYSRSIAALISKGEYIFGLDNDDMYFYKDVFDYIQLMTIFWIIKMIFNQNMLLIHKI